MLQESHREAADERNYASESDSPIPLHCRPCKLHRKSHDQIGRYHMGLGEKTASQFRMIPVRYRPNAASGGWGYGRDLCTAVKRGYTHFDIILLNIHKTTSRWYCMAVVLRPRLLTFACLARHPANCSTALPKVFSRHLPVC